MKVQAVIFDLDGTLTKPVLDFQQIRLEMGLAPDCPGILEALEQMDPKNREQANSILMRHEQYAAENSRLNNGARQLLDTLKAHNIPIGILTRNTRENTLFVAAKHGLHFDGIMDRDSGPAKPDGFGVRKLCEQFGVNTSQTLLVGDYVHDLHAARDAGAIAVLLKTHEKSDEFEEFADYAINQLDELFDVIKRIEQEQSC